MAPATDVKVTAVTDKPAFVEPFKPIEGPTVWYGGDLDVQVGKFHGSSALLRTFLREKGIGRSTETFSPPVADCPTIRSCLWPIGQPTPSHMRKCSQR